MMTPIQRDVVDRLLAAGVTTLVRLPGGFWTYPGCPLSPPNGVPKWWVTIGTVRAMERQGLLAHEHPDTCVLVATSS